MVPVRKSVARRCVYLAGLFLALVLLLLVLLLDQVIQGVPQSLHKLQGALLRSAKQGHVTANHLPPDNTDH